MSSSSSSAIFLFAVMVCLTVFTIATNAVDPTSYSCNNSNNFTTDSQYSENLAKLTTLINYLALPSGYGQGTVGNSPDQVYGLGMCRGDVDSSKCLSCIYEASVKARQFCHGNKGAIIWYDHCMLKYADRNFLGEIDTNAVILMNVNNETENPVLFNHIKTELLGQLSQAASSNSRRFASGEIVMDRNTTIYGMAECTRDLSTNECRKCLDYEINVYLSDCCVGKQGAQVLGGSCSVRYEIYPFLKV